MAAARLLLRSSTTLLRFPSAGSYSSSPAMRLFLRRALAAPVVALLRFAYEPWSTHHYIGVKCEKWIKQHYATKVVKPRNLVEEIRRRVQEPLEGNQMETTTKEVTERDATTAVRCQVVHHSSHREGAIYREKFYWKNCHGIDVTDRSETWLEPMRFSMPTDCNLDPEFCGVHWTCEMVQIFSLKLAKNSINCGSVQLYGYIAARDKVDRMLNYVFNRSRNDPITVEQGSLIEMTGPKRGIAMTDSVMFEFDMRIKHGEQEDDDLQLIDGVTHFYELFMPWTPYTARINGDSGAVDISLACVDMGIEATLEVVISQVYNVFDLSLSCNVTRPDARKEFQLFCGTIGESCGLRRFVVAVWVDSVMQLKFNVAQPQKASDVERYCSFQARQHGCASHQIKLEAASISAKVSWSAVS